MATFSAAVGMRLGWGKMWVSITVRRQSDLRMRAHDDEVIGMYSEYPDDDLLAKEQAPFAEKLDREEGVFSEPDAHPVGTGHQGPPAAPDDYVSDPHGGTDSPGTVDDIPLTFGEQLPEAADEHLVLEGTKRVGGRSRDEAETAEDVGGVDENELWADQQKLLQEDEKEALRLEGFPEEEIPEILEAMGDDAADPLQDFPNGTSATGSWSQPEHGGFPERDD